MTLPTPTPRTEHTREDRTLPGDGEAEAQASPADPPPALVIDPEFRALIPPLTDDERQRLVANLEAHGCLDSLKVWVRDDGQPPVLLDGHNRYDLCLPRGIPFRTEPVPGIRTREEAMIWMLRHQCGRRNLTSYARTELALKLTTLIATHAKQQRGTPDRPFPEFWKRSVTRAHGSGGGTTGACVP